MCLVLRCLYSSNSKYRTLKMNNGISKKKCYVTILLAQIVPKFIKMSVFYGQNALVEKRKKFKDGIFAFVPKILT